MTTIELSINILISITAGAASGYGVFKFLGKKWVENWFAKELKLYEHKLDVLKAKDEILAIKRDVINYWDNLRPREYKQSYKSFI